MKNDSFEIEFEGKKIKVEPIIIDNDLLYKINFIDRPAILIALITTEVDYSPIWTSIPTGWEKLAIKIGEIIEGKMR